MIVAGEDDTTLYAGGDPGVLFESHDNGVTWDLNIALWEAPSRPQWRRDSGGLSVHSIVPWPGDPRRLALAISAAGVWLTEDGGETWRHGNRGIVADYLPEEAQGRSVALCVHGLERAPRRPERMFMQFHGGVYRSDDAGETWTDVAGGLPSDFGFPVVVDPADPADPLRHPGRDWRPAHARRSRARMGDERCRRELVHGGQMTSDDRRRQGRALSRAPKGGRSLRT